MRAERGLRSPPFPLVRTMGFLLLFCEAPGAVKGARFVLLWVPLRKPAWTFVRGVGCGSIES